MRAADSLPSEVASLDAAGVIVWANAAWLLAAQSDPGGLIIGCAVGVNFLRMVQATGTTIAGAIAAGVAALLAGERPSFEQEVSAPEGARRWRFQARPLRGSSGGAVLMRTEIPAPARRARTALPAPEDLRQRIARLTPREQDVLRLMVRGFDNREIAAELGIGYNTARSHSQAVIEKLGARSRLDAVARAHRAGTAEES
jgi:DNA-binding NarL/FixJ family response regulator